MAAAIPSARAEPPTLTVEELHRAQNWAIREFQASHASMTDHAGRILADLVVRRLDPDPVDPIVALVGRGPKGAVALAAARWLVHRGFASTAHTTENAAKLRDDAKRQLSLFRREGGHAPQAEGVLPPARVYLDGLWDAGPADSGRDQARRLVEATDEADAARVAIDAPSGLDADTGRAGDPTIRATLTLALALPAKGVVAAVARPWVGELYLADVGLPRPLYEEWGTSPAAIFGGEPVVRLDASPAPRARAANGSDRRPR